MQTTIAGHTVQLLPVPIRAAPVLRGIGWGRLGTPEQALAKQELARMLTIYERFGAVQQPLRTREGRTIWKVQFPPNSRWASGPERASAFQAILDNFAKNGMFKGYMANESAGEGETLWKIDRIIDNALAFDNAQARRNLNA